MLADADPSAHQLRCNWMQKPNCQLDSPKDVLIQDHALIGRIARMHIPCELLPQNNIIKKVKVVFI